MTMVNINTVAPIPLLPVVLLVKLSNGVIVNMKKLNPTPTIAAIGDKLINKKNTIIIINIENKIPVIPMSNFCIISNT